VNEAEFMTNDVNQFEKNMEFEQQRQKKALLKY